MTHQRVESFEQGTGYDPELLAERAARELLDLLRLSNCSETMPSLVRQAAARAERCWHSKPRWRRHWTRVGDRGDPEPLLVFFRHWITAAAIRSCIEVPPSIRAGFGVGKSPSRRVLMYSSIDNAS